MSDGKGKAVKAGAVETRVRSVGFLGLPGGGAEGVVDVRDGKIVRIRPLHYDWKYDKKHLNPWKLAKNGKILGPLMKSLPGTFSLAYKKRVYSHNRIKYPLKRVDWDPHGERNPQNRDKSKYKRISWDEATSIIADEIKRIHQQYGPLYVEVPFKGEFHGKPAEWKVKISNAKIGDAELDLLEPSGGESALREFLDNHGEGLHHIGYLADDVRGEVEN